MKSLRRSFNNKDNSPQISTPIATLSKPGSAILPPKKVIRALSEHRPQAPQELGFQKGDFFYVVNDIDHGDGWYEANNPMTGARGLVPKSKFEEFNKGNTTQRISQINKISQPMNFDMPSSKSPPLSQRRQPHFYAIVQHDFLAERPDELDAKAGDYVSVVAQSNLEWFVAKPIGKLGRPGLIPVSFVALRDPSTDQVLSDQAVKDLMVRGEVPNVEEWKRAVLNYKATSISLGVLDEDTLRGSVPNSPFMPRTPVSEQASYQPTLYEQQEEQVEKPVVSPLPNGILISAEVVSWHYEMDEYWFRINALFQPDEPSGSTSLPPAKQLVLFRVYNDFYDFQVDLLNTFPVEAGRTNGKDGKSARILPYMPGPAQKVDDKVTIMRREELDTYLVQLCNLWEYSADYILRHEIVRRFFTPKPGDVEEDVKAAIETLNERYGPGVFESQSNQHNNLDAGEQIRLPFAQLNIDGSRDNRQSDGSRYEDQGEPVPHRATSRAARAEIENSMHNGTSSQRGASRASHRRDGSTTSVRRELEIGNSTNPRSHSPYASTSRTDSPGPERSASSLSMRTGSASRTVATSVSRPSSRDVSTYSGPDTPASHQSTAPSTRSRSASNANNPPISASNPNTAFIKIKIFDRLTRELIAIRVSPRVTHEQLLEKVKARLGDDVQFLTYRNSLSNTYIGVDNDTALKSWLEETDKHVLYAD